MIRNQVRIIGGKWRGRKITFPNVPGLRPTPDRVRETLFNWLAPVIMGAECLDLFAGSGVLGFEALSRGAKTAVFVDQSSEAVRQLKSTQIQLACASADIYCQPAEIFLRDTCFTFDIIFFDPPFDIKQPQSFLDLIQERSLLKSGGVLYVEQPRRSSEVLVVNEGQKIKKGQTKQILFHLYRARYQLGFGDSGFIAK